MEGNRYMLCEAFGSPLVHIRDAGGDITLCGFRVWSYWGATEPDPTRANLGVCQICVDEKCHQTESDDASDPVNRPNHYTSHPSGVECIEITEHMMFNPGNAIKYIWRHGLKSGDTVIEDLEKARYYIDREIQRVRPK